MRYRAVLLPVFLSLFSLPAIAQTSAVPLNDPQIVQMATGEWRHDRALGVDAAYLPILYPSSHAANLYQLRNGDILCVWFSGSWEGSSGVGIVMSRLRPGAQRWDRTVLVDHHDGFSYQNPVLFQEPNGTLDLYHSQQEADAGEADAKVLRLQSHDSGHTWSQPAVVFGKPGSFTRHPMIVLPNGNWVLPMQMANSEGVGKGTEDNYSITEISSDQGKTWKECFMAGTKGKIQPTVVQLSPGHLLAFLRSRGNDFIFRSASTDGCTWTPAAPTRLLNNNASVQLFRLQNGHLVLAFNNSNSVRKPLTVALSEDNGATWPWVRNIETGRPAFGMNEQKPKVPGREEYSYPSVMQSRDGTIYVAFTFRRQTIKVVSFPEEWIRRGEQRLP
jgi:predicted neuraminidase